LTDSILIYFRKVQAVQAVQIVYGRINGLNRAQRLNRAKRLNFLNDNLHSPHCRACKERVRELLTAIYGECRVNHQFPWPSHPVQYANTVIGDLLEQIRGALADCRGHRDFIKSVQIPPCDYFIPDPPFILEFDESQHFSAARLVTLVNYPEHFQVGYPISRWQELCRQIDAKDNDPFDRDERRAWYDSLRDLVPTVHGLKPTVRLYADAVEWCSLTTSDRDLAKFRSLLGIGDQKKSFNGPRRSDPAKTFPD
jgi:hypothetical protein